MIYFSAPGQTKKILTVQYTEQIIKLRYPFREKLNLITEIDTLKFS